MVHSTGCAWVPGDIRCGSNGTRLRGRGGAGRSAGAMSDARPLCARGTRAGGTVHHRTGTVRDARRGARRCRRRRRRTAWAGDFRIFCYEVRCWRATVHSRNIVEAVASPVRLSDDPRQAQRLLDLVPSVPTPVRGRDELDAGEMWNSNSVISWLIARSGMAAETIRMPSGGRAPGWEAGLVVARRQLAHTSPPCGETAATIRDHDDDIEDVKEGH